jgi:hypothetical protein
MAAGRTTVVRIEILHAIDPGFLPRQTKCRGTVWTHHSGYSPQSNASEWAGAIKASCEPPGENGCCIFYISENDTDTNTDDKDKLNPKGINEYFFYDSTYEIKNRTRNSRCVPGWKRTKKGQTRMRRKSPHMQNERTC